MSDTTEPRAVRYSPEFGLSTLFRPLPRGPRPALDVTYTPKEGGARLVFRGKEALGVPEQTLMLVLLELAQRQFAADPEGTRLDGAVQWPPARELWRRMHKQASSAHGTTVHFFASWSEMCLGCGCSIGGSSIATRREQLQRLCEVSVWDYVAGASIPRHQSFLVSWLIGNDSRVHLALNHRLAGALFGGRYAQVSLTERAGLEGDATKAIHAALSTMLRHGNGLHIGTATIAQRLWPEADTSTPIGTAGRRIHDVRRGLKAIGELPGWTVEFESTDMAKVTRLAKTGSEALREMPGACHVVRSTLAYREREGTQNVNASAAFGAMDVSGLFSTTGTA